MKAFPYPLTSTQEAKYLKEYFAGDLEAKKILIEHNMRLVAHIAKKYYNSEDDMEDLISVGTIGLLKAVNTFQPTKGSKLATYAARCIDNELLMYFRTKKKWAKDVSLYEPIGTDKEGNQIHLFDILEDENFDVIEDMETRKNIRTMLSLLPDVLNPREYEIITLRFGIGKEYGITQREVAKRLNISRSYVSRIEKKALKKLRDKLEQEN